MTIGTPGRLARALAPILAATTPVGLVSCSRAQTSPQPTHVVTDMSGARVKVSLDVEHVGEQFPAHTVTDIMLGAGSKIVAIPPNVKTLPFLKKMYPQISQNAGIPSVVVGFTTFPELSKSVTLAGEILGGTARRRAQAYVDYLNKNVNLVQSRLANLPESQRPSVVHIASYPPLVVDGGGSSADMWINAAGATNALSDVNGSHSTITAEELLQRNPDVLIIQAPGGDQGLVAGSAQSVVTALSKQFPVWNDLKAVKNHRVYFNPQGMYPWERASPEEALQALWAAKTLHPDLFKDIDMRAEARNFYKEFFNYTLTDADLDQMFQLT
ncbi:MAG: ABC transporter substrate-binding protein [Pseudonocardiaceae bacterium]